MKRLLIALALGLAGCGFQPVYAPGSSASFEAGYVKVEPIAGRSGYMLRRALQQELAIGLPNLETQATLNVILKEELTRLAFKPDGAASRSTLLARGEYVLATDEGVISGRVEADTSFAVPDQPYGDISAQTNATDRAMRQLAKRIVDDLRLKLSTAD
ncbi:MAG: hypothetical protein KDA53_16790 [Hyphomonas sp.]|nr:hypothetical protein [Hyphomonas sp.]